MELTNNSTIETVIDFANVKFGMELTKDQVSEQLRNLSFSETLKLINSIKADDNDAFSSIIDLSAVSEGWSELPSINREKYQERDGLEGPIMTRMGKVVYYDPKEGSYYDPDTDIYLSYEDWKELDLPNAPFRNEAISNEAIDRLKDLAGIKKEVQIDEAIFLAPWVIPALATAVRIGIPALKLLLRGGSKAAPKVLKTGKNLGTSIVKKSTVSGVVVGASGMYVYDKVTDLIDWIKDKYTIDLDDDALEIFAQVVIKYGIPIGAIAAIFYGGKQLKDYMASQEQEQDGEAIPETQLDEYGTISTAQPSRATIRAGKEQNDVANRRSNNINQDMNRDSKVPSRTVAGGNKQPTGTGASRAGSADPDDIERAQNSDTAGAAANQSNVNSQEIERLKQLAMGR